MEEFFCSPLSTHARTHTHMGKLVGKSIRFRFYLTLNTHIRLMFSLYGNIQNSLIINLLHFIQTLSQNKIFFSSCNVQHVIDIFIYIRTYIQRSVSVSYLIFLFSFCHFSLRNWCSTCSFLKKMFSLIQMIHIKVQP